MKDFSIGNLLKERQLPEKPAKKKRGGVQDALTEQRVLTATFLNIQLGQVLGLTRGWTAQQLYTLRKEVEQFTKNPQALWWQRWKKLNAIYGKNQVKIRKTKKINRKNTLFDNL